MRIAAVYTIIHCKIIKEILRHSITYKYVYDDVCNNTSHSIRYKSAYDDVCNITSWYSL